MCFFLSFFMYVVFTLYCHCVIADALTCQGNKDVNWSHDLVQCMKWWHLCFSCTEKTNKKKNTITLNWNLLLHCSLGWTFRKCSMFSKHSNQMSCFLKRFLKVEMNWLNKSLHFDCLWSVPLFWSIVMISCNILFVPLNYRSFELYIALQYNYSTLL